MSELKEAVANRDIETVRNLLATNNFTQKVLNNALYKAIAINNAEIVQLLITNGANITAYNNFPIRYSSENGRIRIVKLLLANGADPTAEDNYAIRYASKNGHTEIVRLLLEAGADPTSEENYAIRWASNRGHLDTVKLLIADPRVDASDPDNLAIKWAMMNNHKDIVYLLSEDPKVIAKGIPDEVKEYLKKERNQDISQVTDAAMALRSTGFDPHVISQILSYNMPAYDVSDLVATVAPIVRPYSLLSHPNETPKHSRAKILRHKYQPKRSQKQENAERSAVLQRKIAKLQKELAEYNEELAEL